MAPAHSKLKSSGLMIIFSSSSIISAILLLKFLKSSKRSTIKTKNVLLDKKKFDADFIPKISKILRILIPTWRCKEVFFMSLISFSLVVRSLCDLWMIYLGTLLESAIISGDKSKFNHHLAQFALSMPTMSLTNSILKYSTDQLSIRFRSRLTKHLMGRYMNKLTYHKLTTLLPNADQLITQDVDRFCNSVAHLYSQLSKPVLDIMIYVYGISRNIGKTVPAFMLGYLALAAGILIKIRKPMSFLTSQEQAFEGDFRYCNSRLITNSEEIAFYNGGKRELLTLVSSFDNLINHMASFSQFKFVMNFMENVVAKYIATVVGYYSVSRPFFLTDNKLSNMSQRDRLESYYKSGRMLINLAQAIGRLVMNGKELSRLSGFTSRVHELDAKLSLIGRETVDNIVYKDYIIKFEKVPIVTPNGDMLIEELNLTVESGTNVLVSGPNGCGKSSLFRILGGLWPCTGGRLTKPTNDKLFYIPQRPYMSIGTLRDQVIYPDTHQDMIIKGRSDADLVKILRLVDLEWIVEQSLKSEDNFVGQRRSFDSNENWMEVLSGGQKQRLAMARLLYHRPQFAILDECTSAVSLDIEDKIYGEFKKTGITLFTVSHRKTLWKFHDYLLIMDGRGGWEFSENSQFEAL